MKKIAWKNLAGDAGVMEGRYRAVFSSGAPQAVIGHARRQTALLYLALALVLLAVFARALTGLAADGGLGSLTRDAYGGSVKHVPATVEADYAGAHVKKDVVIDLYPADADPDQTAGQMQALKTRLPKEILGANESLQALTASLCLPGLDEESGIDILWESDQPQVIRSTGEVNFLTGKAGDEVTLTAYLRKGDVTDSVKIPVTLGEAGAGFDLKRGLSESVDAAVESLRTAGAETGAVSLPEETETGVQFTWRKPSQSSILLAAPLIALCAYFLYRRRNKPIEKAIEERREEIKTEFPDFLGKLILLLQAGLVATSAISRIASDYLLTRRAGEEKAFYEELLIIDRNAKASNTSLCAEFTDFAGRCSLREVQRFSAILSDNIDKGAALSEKLAQEHDTLWDARKKAAEEKGNLAETKLTFPMVLQLLVIILITVAPAAVQMR
ncbi:MAG: hypothetical protein LBR14_03685 [Clostridiales Family XIII bacterium]|jgi:hypothetical protein|nr:hypothetical protein [Clostridiales Family XIII bacterium]